MLIKCPRCQARATLPDSKEGAKVRCGECGRVFVAGAGHNGRTITSSNAGLWIGMALAGAVLVGWLYLETSSVPDETQAAEPVVEEEDDTPYVDPAGWNGAPVRATLALHEAVYRADEARLRRLLEPELLWARENADEEGRLADPAGYARLDRTAQLEVLERAIADLLGEETGAFVRDWEPYDGSAVSVGDERATVRLSVKSREDANSSVKRTVEWELAREGMGSWRAYAWRRWLSPEEERRVARQQREREIEKVTLSDGSVVLEREPKPLAHLETTPEELADEIDGLYPTMVDLDLTREANDARRRMIEIGRPAIPRLLTGLYETPLDNMDNAIRANITVMALREITGKSFGYEPQTFIGSGTGTTEERRQSAIKQWFAWWYLNEKRFTEKKVADGLEGMIELDEKEKAWLERHQE